MKREYLNERHWRHRQQCRDIADIFAPFCQIEAIICYQSTDPWIVYSFNLSWAFSMVFLSRVGRHREMIWSYLFHLVVWVCVSVGCPGFFLSFWDCDVEYCGGVCFRFVWPWTHEAGYIALERKKSGLLWKLHWRSDEQDNFSNWSEYFCCIKCSSS